MTVVLIIAILLLVAVASYLPASSRAAAATCAHNRAVLERAFVMRAAAEDSSETPLTLAILASSVQNPESSTQCPSDGTTYVFDPVAGTVTCPNHP
jgi:Tfp pilus assembly protein PilE